MNKQLAEEIIKIRFFQYSSHLFIINLKILKIKLKDFCINSN